MWPSSIAQTAVISAITAAFVTLLIEFLAKPRLEIRKDRIVGREKLRRDLEADLRVALHHRALVPDDEESMESTVDKEVLAQLSDDLLALLRTVEQMVAHGFKGVRVRLVVHNISEARASVLKARRTVLRNHVAFSSGYVSTLLQLCIQVMRMNFWRRFVWRVPISRNAKWQERRLADSDLTSPPSARNERASGQAPANE
jgi:hypothetical protein